MQKQQRAISTYDKLDVINKLEKSECIANIRFALGLAKSTAGSSETQRGGTISMVYQSMVQLMVSLLVLLYQYYR
jgi:hypothetical protein